MAKTKLETSSLIWEMLKNIAEIAAILIGATWAIFNFNLKEGPTLKKSASATGQINIDSVNSNTVHVNYYTSLKNIGKTGFNVDSLQIQCWIVSTDDIVNSTYFSFDDYMDNHPATISMCNLRLNGPYSPGVEYGEGFDFFVEKNPNKAIITRATYHCKGEEGWFSQQHEWVEDTYASEMKCLAKK